MNRLATLAQRWSLLSFSLFLTLSTVLSSCSGRRSDGSLTIFGVIYLLLAVAAVISLFKQDWSLGKKLLWGAIIWFFPFGGSIIYFLFSGRK